MDGATRGVVLVSFGSLLSSAKMSKAKGEMFWNAFGSLSQRVLLKWENVSLPRVPSNIKLIKWLPQQDVLAHPNLRLFASHGGQSSFQETLCHKKPAVRVFQQS